MGLRQIPIAMTVVTAAGGSRVRFVRDLRRPTEQPDIRKFAK